MTRVKIKSKVGADPVTNSRALPSSQQISLGFVTVRARCVETAGVVGRVLRRAGDSGGVTHLAHTSTGVTRGKCLRGEHRL